MIQLYTPDIFWSDVALGAAAFACAALMYRRHQPASTAFAFGAIAAWAGAVSHGITVTSQTPAGKAVWILSLTCLVASSLALVYVSLNRSRLLPYLAAILLAYMGFAIFISEAFIWAAITQVIAGSFYGISILSNSTSANSTARRQAAGYFVSYVAVTFLAAALATPHPLLKLPLHPLAVFHVVEIAAVILLYLSLKQMIDRNEAKNG